MPEISVNLATYNRAAFLEPCLISLCNQTVDFSRYEICVVNNACTDNTAEVVARVAALYPACRLFMVEEPVSGVTRARNLGIASTTAPLIACIDDDATANPDWLDCFLTRFATLDADVAVIGGEVDPIWGAPPPGWLEPWMKGTLSAASNMGTVARLIELEEGLFEGNCCYRREALTSIGNYPVELGRVGNVLLSGENAMNMIMRAKGWKLFFDPAPLIHHNIHADRLTPLWMRKRLFWQGVSDFAVHAYHKRHGLETVEQINLDLPLQPKDWDFLTQDTAENLRASLMHFESLGFILAATGIMPIDDS